MSSKVIMQSILKKLEKNNASQSTLNAVEKELNKIKNSNYSIIKRLTKIKSIVNDGKTTLRDIKLALTTEKKEIKQKKEEKQNNNMAQLDNIKNAFVGEKRDALKGIVSMFKNLKMSIRDLNIKYKSHDIISIKIEQTLKKNVIKEYGNKLSKLLKRYKINGTIRVALKAPNRWIDAKFTNVGEPFKLPEYYEDEDFETYEQTQFYILEEPLAIGGNDKYNDCVYYALKQALGQDKLPFKYPATFKTFLGINRLDKVKLSDMPKIEEKFKISINVSGDYVYTSITNKPIVVNLKLKNEHFMLNKEALPSKVDKRNLEYKERKPLIYDSRTFECYDGKKIKHLTKEEKFKIKTHQTEYILVNTDPDLTITEKDGTKRKNLTMEEQYNIFIEDAEILKSETNHKINLYKTGDKTTTALALFDSLTKLIDTPPLIEQDEAMWLEKSKIGGLRYANNHFKGKVYKYDFVSMYPSIMCNSHFSIPITRGEFKKLSEEEFNNLPFYQIGIYRAKINIRDEKGDITGDKRSKLFILNENNYYTQTDLNIAKSLNYKIEIIEDDQPNFLHYSKCIKGSQLFKAYVDFLYPLKEKKILRSNRVKQLLNILWGLLSEIKIRKLVINNSHKRQTININKEINRIKPSLYGDSTLIKVIDSSKYYSTSFARLTPFLLSKGRELITKSIKDNEDLIVRICTDGVYFDKEPKNIKTGNKLGELKFEGVDSVEIIHLNRIIHYKPDE